MAQVIHVWEIQPRSTFEDEPIATQEKIKVQEEEKKRRGTKENETILDLEENKIESKHTLEVLLPIVSQTHPYALWIEVYITKQALFSFLMSKFGDEGLYRMFPLTTC